MFKILCEQFAMDAVPREQTGDVMVLQVQCVSGVPAAGPNGQQMMLPVPTAIVQVVMDALERATLRGLLDAFDAAAPAADGEGEPRPEGVAWKRCGRLQAHPSHVHPDWQSVDTSESGEPTRLWCDGQSAMTDVGAVGEATDELPDPTPVGGNPSDLPPEVVD